MTIALAVAVSCGCSFGTYRRVPAEWQPPAKLDCYASRDIATLDLVGIVPVLLLGGITTILLGSCEGACNSDARMGIGAAITVGTAGTLLGSGVWGLGRAAQCRDARQQLDAAAPPSAITRTAP